MKTIDDELDCIDWLLDQFLRLRSLMAESPTATHSHRCQFDGHVWTHANSNAGNAWAHKCPQCGREQWERHRG